MRKLPNQSDSFNKSRQRLSAKGRALSFLSRREHSVFELKRKLLRAGYEPCEIDEAVEWARNQKFQSDQRFSESLHRRRASNYGDRAIQAELANHYLEVDQSQSEVSEVPAECDRVRDWLLRRQKGKYLELLEHNSETSKCSLELLKFKSKCFRSLSHRGFEFRNIEKGWELFVSEF